jgi:hypothetical protein
MFDRDAAARRADVPCPPMTPAKAPCTRVERVTATQVLGIRAMFVRRQVDEIPRSVRIYDPSPGSDRSNSPIPCGRRNESPVTPGATVPADPPAPSPPLPSLAHDPRRGGLSRPGPGRTTRGERWPRTPCRRDGPRRGRDSDDAGGLRPDPGESRRSGPDLAIRIARSGRGGQHGEPAVGAPVPPGFSCGRNARLAPGPASGTFGGCEDVNYTPAYPLTARVMATLFLD